MDNLIGLKIVNVAMNVGSDNVVFVLEDGTLVPTTIDQILKLGKSLPEETKQAPVEKEVPPAKEKEVDKPKEKEPEPEDDPEVEDDFWTEEEIQELDREGLEELIEDEELDIDPEDFDSVRALRKAVIKELDL